MRKDGHKSSEIIVPESVSPVSTYEFEREGTFTEREFASLMQQFRFEVGEWANCLYDERIASLMKGGSVTTMRGDPITSCAEISNLSGRHMEELEEDKHQPLLEESIRYFRLLHITAFHQQIDDYAEDAVMSAYPFWYRAYHFVKTRGAEVNRDLRFQFSVTAYRDTVSKRHTLNEGAKVPPKKGKKS